MSIGLLLLGACLRASSGESLDKEVLDKVKQATVFLKVVTEQGASQGSGFFVDKSVLVTNAHVLGMKKDRGARPQIIRVVLNSGNPTTEKVFMAKLLACDTHSDLAFLGFNADAKLEASLPPPLVLAKADEIRETLPVFIAGFPFGDALAGARDNPAVTIGKGSVSSLRMDKSGLLELIQIDGNLNPGNSGGPIVDAQGRVVAVSVATILGTQVSFSIPCDMVRRNLEGRIASETLYNKSRKGDAYSFDLEVAVFDPLQKVRDVSYYYWTATPGEARPVDSERKVAKYGAPGDSPRMCLKLTRDPATGTWKGSIKGCQQPNGKEIWRHIGYTTDAPERMTEASSLAGNLLDSESAEATVAAEQNGPPLAPGEVVKPVKPGLELLTGVEERDPQGQAFTRVAGKISSVDLGKGLLQIVSAPSGRALYAIFSNTAAIKVVDPATFKITSEISTARCPVSIWCDEKRIVVACTESKVVSIFDAATLKPTKSIPLRDAPDLKPTRILGLAPDGSIMTTWVPEGGAWWDIWLYHVTETGTARKMLKGAVDFAVWLDQGKTLFAQHNFGGSPSGVAALLVPGETENTNRLFNNKLFGSKAGWHRSFAHVFITNDRRSIVLPTNSINEEYGYPTRTYVANVDLSRMAFDFPGICVAEVPNENYFVSWGLTYIDKREQPAEIFYASRSTGRVIRRISINKRDFEAASGGYMHPAAFLNVSANKSVVFVPGHELFLVPPRDSDRGKLIVIKCGPIGKGAVSADPNISVANNPPAVATVGTAVSFTPQFKRPDNAKKIVFKLKKGPETIVVDPATGKLSWTPTDVYIGKYDVEIVADVDGAQLPVLAWTIEVKF
ncbi:MAG: trypsin-like peptidase domain-containing protein [Planctomycetota bacterium]|nr:trypsin-like peptidase domain-containing protein [Planctomycetota bacterium]